MSQYSSNTNFSSNTVISSTSSVTIFYSRIDKMALSSGIIPYLALLSLIVSFVPGFWWGLRRLRQHMNKRHNRHNVEIPLANLHQPPSAILDNEGPHHSSFLPRQHSTNNRRHLVSSATLSVPYYPGPAPAPGYQAVWLSAIFLSPHAERPDRLYTDQSYRHNGAWFEDPCELSSAAGVDTIDHP